MKTPLAVSAIWLARVCQGQGTPLPPSQPAASSHHDIVAIPRAALSTILDQVPLCARSCLEHVTAGRDCADGTCLCLNAAVENALGPCVLAACTISESITTKNFTQAACDLPRRDRATPFNVTSITLCAITGTMVLARLIFKGHFSYASKLGLDDWFIIASIAVGLPCTIINGVGFTRHGLGKDVWTLPPDMIETFSRFFYAQQIMYLFLVTSIKMSLLFFYLSIFPGRGVRTVLWVTMAFTGIFGLTFLLLSIFQCTPIHFYWLRYVQPVHGHCTKINLLGWIHGGVSTAIDVWMIGIPLFEIRKLELHWKKKVGAAIMFLTGTFVTIVSALRLRSLIYFANSINPTWDELPVALWATIEINVGLMCACLPTLRLILVRMWPRVFGSTINSLSQKSAASQATNTSASARKGKIRATSLDTDTAPISPRLMQTNTAFELEAKYPTSEDDRDDWESREVYEIAAAFEDPCHAK